MIRTSGETRVGSKRRAPPAGLAVLRRRLTDDLYWHSYLEALWRGKPRAFAVHLAVFVQPYLSFMLEGRKTVESRFSVIRCAPYQLVKPGDVILLKRSGGPVVGLCRIARAWFYKLDPASWLTIRKEFTAELCAQDPEFWRTRQGASFATLMQVDHLCRIEPFRWEKRDRRGWVVLDTGSAELLFGDSMTSVVLFAGGIASGKTSLSRTVAETLGCPRASFGDYVRKITRRRGLEGNRQNWQVVGESLIRKNIRRFCASVLREASWTRDQALVVDGIRHAEAITALRTLVAPAEVRLIYIDTDITTRERRLQHGSGESALVDLERHSTEVEVVTTLRQMADLVVDGRRDTDEVAREIVEWLRR